MSICAPCTKLLPIDVCATSIIIGTVADANTSYNVYFRNLANDFLVKYKTTSDGDGLITLVPDNGFAFASGVLYEIWVNKTSNINCGDDLTICETTAKCYSVEFERMNIVLNDDQEPDEENIQTLKTVDCC